MLDIITVEKDGEAYCVIESEWKVVTTSSEFLKYWRDLRDYLEKNNVSYDEKYFLDLYFPTQEYCCVHASGLVMHEQIKIEVFADNNCLPYFRDVKDIRSNSVEELVSYIMKLTTEESGKRVKKVIDTLPKTVSKMNRCCCDDTPKSVKNFNLSPNEYIHMKDDIRSLRDGFEKVAEAVSELDHAKDKLNDDQLKIHKRLADLEEECAELNSFQFDHSIATAGVTVSVSHRIDDFEKRIAKLERKIDDQTE